METLIGDMYCSLIMSNSPRPSGSACLDQNAIRAGDWYLRAAKKCIHGSSTLECISESSVLEYILKNARDAFERADRLIKPIDYQLIGQKKEVGKKVKEIDEFLKWANSLTGSIAENATSIAKRYVSQPITEVAYPGREE